MTVTDFDLEDVEVEVGTAEALRRRRYRGAAERHPANFVRFLEAWDEREALAFKFNVNKPEEGWYWQKDLLDWFLEERRCIVLKARQLGVTWLAGAFALWLLLYKPGSLVLVYRQKEEEAAEVVGRIWTLLQSAPKFLWNGAEVKTPARGASAHNEIELKFPSGQVSRLIGMTSTGGAGHGKTAALVLMDEYARIERAAEIMKAVSAVAGQTGRIILISTANGRHNEVDGTGNHFHYLWANSAEAGYSTRFLSWRNHPDRDEQWYATSPETRTLRDVERKEQYPDNPTEAFAFSQSCFFDRESMDWYTNTRGKLRTALYGARFVKSDRPEFARLKPEPNGPLSIYQHPLEGHKYAIGADTATGKGLDYSVAYVVDLTTMSICAELRGKLDADLYAEQLHYLGRWYNDALIAVEDQGGWGNTIITFLMDGKDGRRPYGNQYVHTYDTRDDRRAFSARGFPMGAKTRALVLNALEQHIRDRDFPFLTVGLMDELGSFIHAETNPSPRAAEGCHDDRVMAIAIAAYLFRKFGYDPDSWKRKKQERPQERRYPWQESPRKQADPGWRDLAAR